jgi:hypothetical protein
MNAKAITENACSLPFKASASTQVRGPVAKGQANAKAQRREETQRRPFEKSRDVRIGG